MTWSLVHAPITKSVISLTIFASLLAYIFKPSLDKLVRYEFCSLFTSRFLFLSIGETLCGIALLYNFRIFERQMGSKKYGAYVLLSLFISTLLELFIQYYFSVPTVSYCGPYFLIFSQLVMYYYDVPSLAPISFFANDKMFTYLFAIQLIFSQYPNSGYLAFCGIVAGLLYRIEFLGLEKLEIPDFIAELCKKYILPLLNSISPKSTQSRNQQNTNNNQYTNILESVRNYYDSPQPGRQPSVSNIETLINMGFDRETAVQALTRSNDELQIAIERLFRSAD